MWFLLEGLPPVSGFADGRGHGASDAPVETLVPARVCQTGERLGPLLSD
jgi:hypothetical protein